GEADEDWNRQPSELQAIDEALEIHATRRIPAGMDLKVSRLVDGEVTLTPPRHVVELGRFGQRPRDGSGSAPGLQASACDCAHLSRSQNKRHGRNAKDQFWG